MDEILAISLRSLQGDMARVEQIGMNLANVLTPGYKRGVAVRLSDLSIAEMRTLAEQIGRKLNIEGVSP